VWHRVEYFHDGAKQGIRHEGYCRRNPDGHAKGQWVTSGEVSDCRYWERKRKAVKNGKKGD
jgi:hypothetical protein